MLEREDAMFPDRSRPETVGPPLPHINPHESASCSFTVAGPQTAAEAAGYTAGQESEKVVGGSTRQPPTAHARMDPEAPLASSCGGRGYFGNYGSSAPHTPG